MAQRIIKAVPLLFSALFTTPAVLADTTIRLEGSKQAANTLIQVKGEMARMSQSGQPHYALYDKSRNLAIFVDTERREYREIDQATLDKYAGMMAAVREKMVQMRAQLEMLPPAQRAMVEQQMQGMLPSPEGEAPDLKDLKTVARGQRTVAGFDCQLHELMQGQQAVGEVCLATAADAGMPEADFATLMAMMGFLRDLAGTAQKLAGNTDDSARILMSGLQGVPVAAKDYQAGREFLVAEVSTLGLDDALFGSYRTFSKQDMLEGLSMTPQ